jgi:hypothetical protein
MIDIEAYNEKIKNLTDKVEKLTDSGGIKLNLINISNINQIIKKNINYILVLFPVIIFILFIIIKPKFILTKYTNPKTHFTELKINYKKIFIVEIVLCGIIFFSFFYIKKHYFLAK